MEKNVTITVLAKDVIENSYFETKKCPITRALLVAGCENLEHTGTGISVIGEKDDMLYDCIDGSSKEFRELNRYIADAYEFKRREKFDKIKDFTITLTLNFE